MEPGMLEHCQGQVTTGIQSMLEGATLFPNLLKPHLPADIPTRMELEYPMHKSILERPIIVIESRQSILEEVHLAEGKGIPDHPASSNDLPIEPHPR